VADRAWLPLGDRAIRFARPSGVPAGALVRAVRAWPGVIDVVVAREDVAAYYADAPRVAAAQLAALATLTADGAAPAREHALRVCYDGPDLADVARATGLSPDEVARRHAAATYTVDTLGFQPGFAYLVGLDRALVLPRRATPRPRVPAGSLAIAAEYTGVYPFDSPGGWHLIGRAVDVELFGERGALLAAGDRVRFVS
jgi:KipI family sensor histidine kinase inhibitor